MWKPIAFVWTWWKLRSCKCLGSQQRDLLSCRESRKLHETWERFRGVTISRNRTTQIYIYLLTYSHRHSFVVVDHVAVVCRSGYFLQQLPPVLYCSTEDATKTMVQAFITISRGLWQRTVLRNHRRSDASPLSDPKRCRSAADGTRRSHRISPVLRQLHWPPMRKCAKFKVATVVHQALSGHAPSYVTDDCCLVTDARPICHKEDCTRKLDLESGVKSVCRLTSVIQPFQTVSEDILFGRSLKLKRSVNPPFHCALEILLLTYLLTYLQQ